MLECLRSFVGLRDREMLRFRTVRGASVIDRSQLLEPFHAVSLRLSSPAAPAIRRGRSGIFCDDIPGQMPTLVYGRVRHGILRS